MPLLHTAEKQLKLTKKYARACTASFCHQWGILKLLQAKISRSTENIGRLRGFKIVNGRSHYVLFKIEKSPFITSFYYCIWHWIKRKNIEKKMKKSFWPSRDLNPWPSRSIRQQIFDQVLPQNGIILTAYEVKLNHQYLSIFSVDFCFFGHCSFSVPHRSQKDPLCALAYFLANFSRFSAVWWLHLNVTRFDIVNADFHYEKLNDKL